MKHKKYDDLRRKELGMYDRMVTPKRFFLDDK